MARVLIVDDEPETQEMLNAFLADKGYTAIQAADGEEALRKLKAERPHAMLLDLRLPGVSGLDVLRRLREVDREVAVIVVTAEADEEAGREALKRGAYDFLTKPVDLDYLERCLWYAVTPMLL